MEKYWYYWKKGWWAQLIMLLFNIGTLIIIFPNAILFGQSKNAYYIVALLIFVLALVPFGGWLFSKFIHKFTS